MLYKHVVDDHEEEEDIVDFEMTLTNCFKNPISRIINEGIRIKNKDPKTLLNSKSEFYGPSVKRRSAGTEQCHLCGYNTNNPNNLKVHIFYVHEIEKFKCNVCSVAVNKKNNLKIHMQEVHERKSKSINF